MADLLELGIMGSVYAAIAIWILIFLGNMAKKRRKVSRSREGMLMQYIWHIYPPKTRLVLSCARLLNNKSWY
jgi:hypothetical protein